jgi:hypothetical protein
MARHYHNHSSTNNTYSSASNTTQEHRAPTDDSVRILQETEQAVRDTILSKHMVHLQDTKVEAIALECAYDAMEWKRMFLVGLKLNGREYKGTYYTEVTDSVPYDAQVAVLDALVTLLREKIAPNLCTMFMEINNKRM